MLKRGIVILLMLALIAGAGPAVLAATPVATPAGYAHPEWLVDVEWLAQHRQDANVRIVALTPEAEFDKAHIEGAVQIDWPDLTLSDSSQLAAWQSQMEAILTRLGIERDDTVVVYDGGTLYAPRLWWILYQLGHADVRVLNGGMPAWTEAGLPVATGPVEPTPAPEPYVGQPNEAAIVTVDQVAAGLGDPGILLVDARSPGEYADGHIPGAVSFPFTDVAESGQPPYWKPADQLLSELAAVGVTPDKRVITYCSTGVRGATLYFTLRLLGFEDAALFSGSYAEWTADPNRPVETS